MTIYLRQRPFIKSKRKFNQMPYSTKHISKKLLTDIVEALQSINTFGSVELYVQDNTVTQITVRNIKKTNGVK
jgi:hypothetical protein